MCLRPIAGYLLLALAFTPVSRAEAEPEKADQNFAVALFERLIPGLKITRIGTAEPVGAGGTRFVGANEIEFATKSGETVRAVAGAVSVEPGKNLVTLAGRPTVRFRTHSLIATADETRITYRTDTGKITASGPHRIALGNIGKKSE